MDILHIDELEKAIHSAFWKQIADDLHRVNDVRKAEVDNKRKAEVDKPEESHMRPPRQIAERSYDLINKSLAHMYSIAGVRWNNPPVVIFHLIVQTTCSQGQFHPQENPE